MEFKKLDIFCDASIVSINGEYIGCAGAIAVPRIYEENNNIIKMQPTTDATYRILRNSTNNNSEITAILCGVLLANKYNEEYDEINIISDSKICIYGLTEWIYSWIENYDEINNILYGSSGIVANQQIFIQIINLVIFLKLKLHFYHQKGHTDKCTREKARQTFKISNNILLDDVLLDYINKYNDIIDKTTRQNLYGYINGKSALQVYQKFPNPISYKIYIEYMEMYQCLIERGNVNGF